MGVRYTDPPFLTPEEQGDSELVASLKEQLAAKDAEIEALRMDLDLADLTIDHYSRGLMD